MATWYANLTLIDGTGAAPKDGVSVRIDDDGTIGAIEHGAVEAADGVDVVDCAGTFLTPGLIDAHSHLGLASEIDASMRLDVSVAETARDIFVACSDALDAGFTTIRDVGGLEGAVPDLISRGRLRGPRVLTSGPVQCQTGGHGQMGPLWEPSDLFDSHEILGLRTTAMLGDGPDAIRRNVRETFRRGADLIKMCVTGGVITVGTDPRDTQLTIPEIRAAVEEAEARHTYVTVHAHNNAGVRAAVEAGVKCVEHGSEIDAEVADLMAANDVALVPTLAPREILRERMRRIKENAGHGSDAYLAQFALAESLVAGMQEVIPIARKAGVLIGLGADITGPRQKERAMELVLRAAVEDPMAALVSATRDNARICRLDDRIGTVEVGKIADLCLWSRSPVEDVNVFTDTEQLALVLQGGMPVAGTRVEQAGVIGRVQPA
ncbi:metal-dependent hydrolase family protein [Metallococcus carri]|uniref:metal-dependent hydrolase family protein n=1 Tax=Metallococcus carri TaxID=1656884 RepID=UPI001A9D50D1|nr:amidohydrolase family protein [Metallococcus carri]